MFVLFKAKEVKLFMKGLDLLEHRIGSSSSFSQIRQMIAADMRRSEQPYIHAIRNSNSPEIVAATSVSNAAGDMVESGSMCIYRGLLSPAGEEMFQLYKDSMDALVDLGFIESFKRDEELAAIQRNIQTVG
jgi:hypothetical protein